MSRLPECCYITCGRCSGTGQIETVAFGAREKPVIRTCNVCNGKKELVDDDKVAELAGKVPGLATVLEGCLVYMETRVVEIGDVKMKNEVPKHQALEVLSDTRAALNGETPRCGVCDKYFKKSELDHPDQGVCAACNQLDAGGGR